MVLGFLDSATHIQIINLFTPNWNILESFENVLLLFGVTAGIVVYVQYGDPNSAAHKRISATGAAGKVRFGAQLLL